MNHARGCMSLQRRVGGGGRSEWFWLLGTCVYFEAIYGLSLFSRLSCVVRLCIASRCDARHPVRRRHTPQPHTWGTPCNFHHVRACKGQQRRVSGASRGIAVWRCPQKIQSGRRLPWREEATSQDLGSSRDVLHVLERLVHEERIPHPTWRSGRFPLQIYTSRRRIGRITA